MLAECAVPAARSVWAVFWWVVGVWTRTRETGLWYSEFAAWCWSSSRLWTRNLTSASSKFEFPN